MVPEEDSIDISNTLKLNCFGNSFSHMAPKMAPIDCRFGLNTYEHYLIRLAAKQSVRLDAQIS